MDSLIKISLILVPILHSTIGASVTVTNSGLNSANANHCENIVCQPGFACDPNYRCTRAPCVPKCLPIGVRTACDANEELSECGAQCEPTCENENPICPMICGPAACKCSQGFVREPMGRCISRSQCPMARLPRPRNQPRA